MKACVECKFFKGGDTNQVYDPRLQQQQPPECTHPKAASRDMIYGKALCANERGGIAKGGCGRAGKFWEAKA